MKEKLTSIIVGCGHRGREAAMERVKYSDKFKVIGLVDPDEHILEITKKNV